MSKVVLKFSGALESGKDIVLIYRDAQPDDTFSSLFSKASAQLGLPLAGRSVGSATAVGQNNKELAMAACDTFEEVTEALESTIKNIRFTLSPTPTVQDVQIAAIGSDGVVSDAAAAVPDLPEDEV